MYIKRTITPIMQKASKTFPVVLITGPRRVGKTTVFEKSTDEHRKYVSLDDPEVMAIAETDPALFFKTYTPPLLLDEVQNAPQLFPYIKMICDKERKNGLFWMTGSQIFKLMKNVSESLAGRVALLDLQGLSQSEKNGNPISPPFTPSFALRKDIKKVAPKELYEVILRGSYPALIAQDPDWNTFYRSYLKTYIERDIRRIVNITQEGTFVKFIKLLAARTSQVLNFSDLARDLEITSVTVKAWVSALETSGLIFILRPYHANIGKRLIKAPKIYFYDTGLVAYLTGQNTAKLLETGMLNGAILETYVISEIIKSYIHNGKSPEFFFYRDSQGKEIDLLIENGLSLTPVEIKKTASPSKADIKNFDVLKELKKDIGLGAIICMRDEPLAITKDVVAMPVTYI